MHRGRYIFYLVTKERSYHIPTYKTFRVSLEYLADFCLKNKVSFLALPRIGCGLDLLNWPTVKQMIYDVFKSIPITIRVYTPTTNSLNAVTRQQTKAAVAEAALSTAGDNTKRDKYLQKATQNVPQLDVMEITPPTLIKEQLQDTFCKPIIDFRKFGLLPGNITEAKAIVSREPDYFLHNNILYRLTTISTGQEPVLNTQVVIPQNLKKTILQHSHDHLLAGHLAVTKMLTHMRKSYFWKNMTSDIKAYVSSCPTCLATKKPTHPFHPELTPHAITTQPFEMVTMDFVGPLVKTTSANRYICVLVDSYSRYSIIWPSRTLTAPEIAKQFFERVICKHGCPKRLQTDNGSTFTSDLFKALNKMYGIKQTFSSAYRPQTQGLTERCNKSILSILRAYVDDNQTTWDRLLCSVEFALNNSVMTSLGHSPYYMIHGRLPIMPAQINIPDPTRLPQNSLEVLEDIISRQEQAFSISRQKMQDIQDQMKKRHDGHIHPHQLHVGSTVYLHKPIRKAPHLKFKMVRPYTGPYTVTKAISKHVVKLRRLSDGRYFAKPVHVSRLKQAMLRRTINTWDPDPDEDPLETDMDLSQPDQDNNPNPPAPTPPPNRVPPKTPKRADVANHADVAFRPNPTDTIKHSKPMAIKDKHPGPQSQYFDVLDVKEAIKTDGHPLRLLVYFTDGDRKWLPLMHLNEQARNIIYKKQIQVRKIPFLRSRYQ